MKEFDSKKAKFLFENYYDDKLVKYCKKYVKAKEPDAMYYMAQCYLKGWGVSKDPEKGKTMEIEAAERGSVLAQSDLGGQYGSSLFRSPVFEKNFEKSVYWERRASENGNAHSQYMLAMDYLKHPEYVTDDKDAIYWLKESAKGGNLIAKEELEKMNEIPDSFEETNNKNKTPADFYTDCVAAFHEEAKKNGVATKGLIFIPELIPIGNKMTLAFLKDAFFQMQFGNNPQTYYYVIFSLCIDSGMVIADKWHYNYGGLNDSFVDQLIKSGPAQAANEIMQRNFPESIYNNQGNEFFGKIFKKWIELHEPYWELSDPRDYTFHAMLAGFQLGVSMILEKYGL